MVHPSDIVLTGRRAPDGMVSRVVAEVRGVELTDTSDAALIGQLLLASLGALSLLTVGLLSPDAENWLHFAVVSVVMALVVGGTRLIPWPRLSPRALLVFPVLGLLAFGALGIGTDGLFAPMGGFSVLCFVYVGLTQPPRTSLLLLPFSCGSLALSYGALTEQVGVRLLVSSSVQVILAEVIAGFVKRQAELTVALQSAAFTDVLTGIPNRRDFETRLAAANPGTVVVACDLDHFKQLNDTHGHSTGDAVLADFGRLLRTVLREDDYYARIGGEEFVVLLDARSTSDPASVIERLRAQWRLMQPLTTFSAGVAVCRKDRGGIATLAAADRALYAAKDAGRDTWCREELIPEMTSEQLA